jgi:CMP-N-acetylneuraminic acid synthetase
LKTIAIIPARGSSERLPNKNTMLLGGLPLLVHSIQYALNQSHINSVYVSTNDALIKSIALEYGAKVIDRPESISEAYSTTVSALKHVLKVVNEAYDYVVLLQPTNPLRPTSLFSDTYTAFMKNDCDSLMTVSRSHHKLGKIVNNKFLPFNYKMGQRSQDLEPLYFENGLLYITKASLVLEDKILGTNNLPYIVNHPYASVDIDTQEDFELAEFILKQYPNA